MTVLALLVTFGHLVASSGQIEGSLNTFLSSEFEHFETFRTLGTLGHPLKVLAQVVTFGHLEASSEQIEGSLNTFGQFRHP